jgi:hypothetical protein
MVLDAGYDGVYLDIVDAYQYWEPGGPGSPEYPTAEEDTVEFVKGIVEYARVTEGPPTFRSSSRTPRSSPRTQITGPPSAASARRTSSTTATAASPPRRQTGP